LCQGITESLINSLSQLQRLRVVARGTAFRYKGNVDLSSVWRELNVRAVVTGRIVARGGNIKVQAELVDLATDSQLWGGQYNREHAGIFDVQEEISREICNNLRLRFRDDERKRLRKRTTQSPEAYQFYLRGRYCSEKRTEEGLQKGIDYFHRAIDKDPNYALAFAGLADSYTLLGSGTYGALSAKSAITEAKMMATKALAIDDTLAEAQTSLAFLRFRFDWAWSDAEREFTHAITLNPRYARAHHWYALFLAAMGRHNEAVVEINHALELDPLAVTINTAAGRISHFARRYDDAIEQFKKTLDLDPQFIPAHFDLGAAYEQKSMFQEALMEFHTCVTLSGGNLLYRAAVAEAHAHLGKRDEAIKILDELRETSSEQYLSPSDIALIYSALGDHHEALALMERAYERRDASLVWSKVAPEADPLRGDPRFQDLLHRMNLSDA
jgi:TolB-like protein/Tfp pilus assembly protein PilF